MKLTVLTNILTPYRIPLYQAMAEQVDEFSVLLMARTEENRKWEIRTAPFPVHVLPGFHVRPGNADVSVHLNYGVISLLRRLKPDVVLNAGFALANIEAFVYCKLYRKRFIHWAHLSLRDGAETSLVRRRLRHWLIVKSDGAIGESSHARDAFIHYGAAPDRVLIATMPLDVSRLHTRVLELRQTAEHRSWRDRLSKPVLLSIGQIIQRKGYQELFAIYERLLATHPDTSLIMVGDGPDRSRFEAQAKQQGWKHVHFIGFVQANDLPKYFAVSDAFIFHTLYDPFGLVLSEAMAAEVPVVSSIHAMATHDLVEDGITGFRIDPRNAESSADTIRRLLDLPAHLRAEMAQAAYHRVLPCDSRSSADKIVRFLESVCGSPHRA